jgi:hypothetical protein
MMTKAIVLASALFAFGVCGQMALAAEAKSALATTKAECERDATQRHYDGKQKTRFIRQCLARARSKDKAARRLEFPPLDLTATPQVTPLETIHRPARSMGNTAPSNAPVAPSAPVIGSTGTSTTGSSATSISGSSGTSIGSSRGR